MASNIDHNSKGYEHQFVDPPPDDLVCLICLSVARDPQQVNCCGKVLCRTCLEEHKKHSNSCPQCRKKITSFADKRSERHILSLRVKCDNTPNGCRWIGELRSLEKHFTICDYILLPCPNECKYGNVTVKLLRKNIETHKKKKCPRRRYKCPHCRESGEYRERTTTHLEECPKMKIPCPNDGCDEEIEHCNMSQHHKECLYEMDYCKYTNIGCMETVLRKDLEEHHNDSQQHLQLAIDKVNQQEMTIKKHGDKIVELQDKIAQLQDKIAQLQFTRGPMKFKITGFDKLKMSGESFHSPGFYISPGGYKMCIKVDCNGYGISKGTHVSVYAYLMRGENDDHLPWPFTGTVTVELLNQLEDDNHYSDNTTLLPNHTASQRVVNEERASSGSGFSNYIRHSDLGYNAAKHCQYLKDDCLYFRIKIEAESASKPWLV